MNALKSDDSYFHQVEINLLSQHELFFSWIQSGMQWMKFLNYVLKNRNDLLLWHILKNKILYAVIGTKINISCDYKVLLFQHNHHQWIIQSPLIEFETKKKKLSNHFEHYLSSLKRNCILLCMIFHLCSKKSYCFILKKLRRGMYYWATLSNIQDLFSKFSLVWYIR